MLGSSMGLVRAQLSGTFSFGAIASPENNLSVFSGPITISSDTSCLRVANGVILSQLSPVSYDRFSLDCLSYLNNLKPQFYLFPNPANNLVRLYGSGFLDLNRQVNLVLHDMGGRIVMKQSATANQLYNGLDLSITSLTSGIYFITVHTSDQQYTIRFVKAKN